MKLEVNGIEIVNKKEVVTAKWKPTGLFLKFKNGQEKTITNGVIFEVLSRAIIGQAIHGNLGITEQ